MGALRRLNHWAAFNRWRRRCERLVSADPGASAGQNAPNNGKPISLNRFFKAFKPRNARPKPIGATVMTIETLNDLFLHNLKDVLYAERKILKALPEMERKATDPKLKATLASHRGENEDQIVRLEEVFASLGKPARGAKCDAMVGLIDEAEGLMADIDDAETMDAALISLVQAVGHYEIARYGTLVAWAKQLGYVKAAALLKATLDEEYGVDKALSKLAVQRLNAAAAT